jgi:hypothetical protein
MPQPPPPPPAKRSRARRSGEPPPAPASAAEGQPEAAAAPAEPAPFWHGALWEPLPIARWTQWTEAKGDPGDADGAKEGGDPLPLNEVIRQQRERLRLLPERNLPMLRGLRDNIRRLIEEKLQAPRHRVLRVHHQRLVLDIQERIEELERGEDLQAFERNIQPFVLAHAEATAGSREAPRAEAAHVGGSLALPKAVIDAMVPAQQRLYRRMMQMIERGPLGSGAAASSSSSSAGAAAAASGGPAEGLLGGAQTGRAEPELVRHMFSRLWVSTHAPAAVHTLDQDICQRCSIPMTRSTREQMLICGQCGFSMAYIDSTEAARTYGDDAEYNPNASHRFNHFQEFATRAQAREVKPVPRGVLAKVAWRLRDAEGVAAAEDVTLDKVVRAVADLGSPLREYKKNVVQICAQLSGRWPVQLTAEQMFMARSIFFEILNAFELLFPSEKWFRNKFVMSVICHTMGWEEMLQTLDAIEGVASSSDTAAGGSTAELRRTALQNPWAEEGGRPATKVSATPAAAAAAAVMRNVPRAEMEEAELRMRAIFRHMGWQYRGPCVLQAGEGGRPQAAAAKQAPAALPFSHPSRT